MLDFLRNKVVLVTGGESGIGRSIANACAAWGAAVCVAGLNEDGLQETVSMIDGLGQEKATAVRTDIRYPDQVENMIEHVDRRWGRLDAAIANAGIVPAKAPAHTLDLKDWNEVISVNLTGTFLTVAAAARYLVAQNQGGSILATGSSTAIRAFPGSPSYIAAKGGVHALMMAMALELGPHRIRVNTIVPGQTDTPPLRAMTGYAAAAASSLPLGEIADPDEIGRLVAFAISDAVPHMTGAHLKIDSGRTVA